MRLLAIGMAAAVGLCGCQGWSAGSAGAKADFCGEAPAGRMPVTVTTAKGRHCFLAERAVTAEEQQRGLMYRTDLDKDFAMLFWPYPAGGEPRVASFWMHNTPTSLDIVFIRTDGTVANIAENTIPFSDDPVPSEGPVGAVLEIVGGRSAELGLQPGDKITWPADR